MTNSIIRTTCLALAATALIGGSAIAPAIAEDTNSSDKIRLSDTSVETWARHHLARQGYRNITQLTRDANGAWRGLATKDGQVRVVAVKLSPAQ